MKDKIIKILKNKNILIVAIIIAVILIATICIIIFSNNNKPNNNANEEKIAVREDIEVKKVEDINVTYNIEQTINNIIERLQGTVTNEGDPVIESLAQTMPELITKELRLFNVEEVYEADYNDELTFYFTEGYLMYDDINDAPEGNISKQTVKIILYRNKKNNNYTIEQYGTKKHDLFKFDDNDISKTAIKAEIYNDELHFLEEKMIFSKKYNIEEKVTQAKIIEWYYNDYRNKLLFENQNREEYKNGKILKIEGKSDQEYVVTLNDEREVRIKPGNAGKEYSVL
ncbi:MAG: hypothetical protein IKF17_03560 [Clostridia bacterium]|nr:hypothetical protein [Clostridia bacterium]